MGTANYQLWNQTNFITDYRYLFMGSMMSIEVY